MLSVSGVEWQIVKVRSDSNELMRSNGTYALGCTDANVLTIFISNVLRGQLLWIVLCHEICHAYCLSNHVVMPIEYEEQLCNFVAKYGQDIIDKTNQISGILDSKYKMQ
jgi:hypothetical protein